MADTRFAERFLAAMEKQNLKQVDLLRAAQNKGVKLGKSQISQYVNGKAVPRETIAQFLAKELGVTMQWLYGKEDLQQMTVENKTILSEREKEMRTFKKSTKLDNVLYDVRGPVVEEAARMEENGTHVLKLNIGNPAPFGFTAPEEVIFDMRDNIMNSQG